MVWRPVAAAIAVLMLVVLAFSSAAGGAPERKTYSVTPASQPGTALSGTLSWTITNTSTSPQAIGSAEIRLTSAFSGFSVTSVSSNATLDGSVIKLRNLSIAPNGGKLVVTAGYTAGCSGGATTWQAEAKQSNDFLGTNNNFLNGTNKLTSLSATIPTCGYKLVFAPGRQPADAALAGPTASQAVTSEAGNPTGAGVQVWAVPSTFSGTPTAADILPIDGAQVDVATVQVDGVGSFSGSFATTNGVATLTGVVLSSTSPAAPIGTYRLRATGGSPTTTSVDSDPFDVASAVCPNLGTRSDECTADLTVNGSGNSTFTYTAKAIDLDNSNANQGATALSLRTLAQAPPAACSAFGTFTPIGPSGVQIDVRPLAGKLQVTVAISKLDRQYTQNNGLAKIDMCIATNLPFTTKSGQLSPASGNEFVGVMPNCPATTNLTAYGSLNPTDPSPCMVSRQSVGGGAKLVFELPNTGLSGANGLEGYDPKTW